MDNSLISSPPVEQLFKLLNTSAAGLTTEQASREVRAQLRLEKEPTMFRKDLKILIRQLINPLVLLLAVAAVLSGLLGESSDAIIILVILLATCLLGFWQEASAGRALAQLRKMIENKHTVLRSGKRCEVGTREVVQGDVLLLDAGDIIPADCRIIESNELHVNESTLTGESFPAEKMAGEVDEKLPFAKKYNCLWQGTNVISGTAKALAVQTGSNTIFGEIGRHLLQTPETSFEKGIRRFGYFLMRITIVLALIILTANLYFHKPLFDSLSFSLALAVGMAPELLPAIMTFSMSAGARRMMKKKVIVKKLSSIFNFGEVNILCSDKTGTITEGKITVHGIVDAGGEPNEQLQLYAFLNASFQNGFTNPIDEAISALKNSTDGYTKINEVPYDFIRKRLTVAVEHEGQRLIITKGAFANILEVCNRVKLPGAVASMDDTMRKELETKFVQYSKQGFRTLGLACKNLATEKVNRECENNMIFLGFILLEDPLKETTRPSIERLKQLSVTVRIITGDNRYAALHCANELGMENPLILCGDELSLLSPEALVVKARDTLVFAEIDPHQKEQIIKALQKSNVTVAYIGDGINDVSAINAADIGISTNNAVDVAREAADFVLLDKNLDVLADGIVEGRRSFANTMKYIFITTGATFGNMLSVAGASLLLPFLPMLPKQILLTNLITDFPFLTIASDKVDSHQLQKPGRWNLKLIRRFMLVFGLHSSVFDMITFYILYVSLALTPTAFQTGWFLESATTELLILFIIRTRRPFIKSTPGKLLLATSLFAVLLIFLLPFSPFAGLLGFSVGNWQQLTFLFFIFLAYCLTADLLKIYFFKRNAHLL